SARALIPLAHPPARAPLLALLADDSLPVRAAAAEALGAYRDPRNADALLAAMADDDDAVRLACLKALLPLRDPRIIEPCLNILDDAPYHGDAALTLAAIEAAGRLRDARAAPLLLPLLSDRERKDEHGVEMAGHAYAALRRIGTPALIALLADIPPDVEPQRRRNAIRALGRWQHPRAMAPLLALLDDPDTSVCNAVIEALTIQHCQLYYTATLQDLLLPPREPIALSIPRAAPRAWCRDARLVDALIARLERNAGGLHELARIGTPRALDAILTEMKHPSQHRSRQAVQFLQFFDEPRATDAVFAYMAANPSRSSEVHSWLAACKNPPPLAKLEPMLRDKDSELRKAAIAALGAHREARAVPALLKIVGTDPVPEVREYCALALGLIGDTRAVPALINRLNDPVEWARSAAAWALGQIGDPRAIPALKKKAAGAEPRFAVRIGRSLAQLGDPLGAEMMAEALRSPDQMARSIAAQTVHDVPAAQRIPLLLGMIESTDGMRYSVLQAFRRVNDPAAVEALIPLLQERRAGVYVGVVEALGRTGAPQAREPLAACLTHADEVFATTAAIALVRLGDVRGLPLVRETLADPVGSLRVEALLALGDGPALFPADSDEREALCDQIAGLLTDPDPLIGALAARALGQYGDPRGADFLLAQLTTEDDAVVLGLTIPYLAALRDPRAVKPLQARLPKLPFTVRLQIVEALRRSGNRPEW
ncbi:MAG TPA: HEAT repeat domain-containing protein, partial [Armatimonadota bacterium]|nr:HEAT repeat domain-containing protein [Armatimonadota bacterium]